MGHKFGIKQTKTDTNRQKRKEMDRNGQKQTETDRNRHTAKYIAEVAGID